MAAWRALLNFCRAQNPVRQLNESSPISAALKTIVGLCDKDPAGICLGRTTLESGGLSSEHQWGVMLSTSARVALPTFVPLVATRYIEVVKWCSQVQKLNWPPGA